MIQTIRSLLLLSALLTGLAACAGSGDRDGPGTRCMRCGTITMIEPRLMEGESSGAGALAGAVAGGVLGHQFGSGRGRDAATAAGAIGGAMAGNEIERRNAATRTVYEITVRMESGGIRQLLLSSPAGLVEGDRVEIIGNQIRRM